MQIRLDILGLLDFQKRVVEFDAVLVDSHLLGILELTGGAAFRLSWGREPYVVLTVGGFHPGYSPAPLVVPAEPHAHRDDARPARATSSTCGSRATSRSRRTRCSSARRSS